MKFIPQAIPGAYVIEPEPFEDDRGVFRRHFCQEEFTAATLISDVRQCNVSENRHKHTLRGFHYQVQPFCECKTMSCLKGAMYDIVVDLRPASPTYLKWVSVELNDRNRRSVHIPQGCANAFLTLEDDSIVHYYCSEFYHPEAEKGIRYNDPLFQFKWPVEPAQISRKDLSHLDFVPEPIATTGDCSQQGEVP